ncbi:MAG: SAM-dependent methyltransferase [Cyanobacteria bacterium J06635_10]
MSEIQDFVSFTSQLIAAQRAIETQRADRLFEDPFAAKLAGTEAFTLLQPEKNIVSTQKGRPYIAVRTRFFDDFLISLASKFRQVVILGAGMDTRAFRISWYAQTHVYEIDRKEVIAYKNEILKNTSPKSDRHCIASDIKESWCDLLVARGYRTDLPSVWLLEGLLMYLSEAEVHDLLSSISNLTVAGSYLGADLVNIKALEGDTEMKKHWRSGFDEPEKLLSAHGWKASVVQPGDEGANFGRYTNKLPPRTVPDVKRVFLITATK